MTEQHQTPLIPESELPPADNQMTPPVTADATILAALGAFELHMRDEGFALNTTKAFASDVRLLGKFLGVGQPIGQIGTKDLNDFFLWLMNDRGIPCSPKSYARRVTTIKVFFSWLHKAGVLPDDPAIAVIQRSVRSPIPTLPNEVDIERSLAVTQRIRAGTADQKPDARPHLLLTLLLKTGIKKGEAMTMVPNHIDRSHADAPMLFVRYANPRLRYKERRLPLEPEWLEVLDEYLGQYAPSDTLFTCTARNLEYVLSDVGTEIGLAQGLLSFENLRWFCALSDYKAGEEPDEIRQKLGLSKITWRETKVKLEQLAKPEGEEGIGNP